jgi:hypothetical protein
VTSGINAVDSIAAGETDAGDRPTEDCVINSVIITES